MVVTPGSFGPPSIVLRELAEASRLRDVQRALVAFGAGSYCATCGHYYDLDHAAAVESHESHDGVTRVRSADEARAEAARRNVQAVGSIPGWRCTWTTTEDVDGTWLVYADIESGGL